MQSKKLIWTSAVVLMTMTLVSCNLGKAPEPTPDVQGIYTSAAQTMIAGLNAQQTQTAQAMPTATDTPAASITPLATFAISTGSVPFGTPFVIGTPGTLAVTLAVGTLNLGNPVGCNAATQINESVPYDGTIIAGGKVFEKAWGFYNSGTCTWDDGYSFDFKSGDRMQGEDIIINKKDEFTAPNHTQNFIVQLQAPRAPGEYKGFWQMKGDDGNWFGALVWVDIVVGRKSEPTATATPHH